MLRPSMVIAVLVSASGYPATQVDASQTASTAPFAVVAMEEGSPTAPGRHWPPPTALVDPDSLYRAARTEFSRGNFQRAAELFQQLRREYHDSRYLPQALYYEAFARYRLGGDADLRHALTLLETLESEFPGTVAGDAEALAARIEGTLARHGDAEAAADVLRRVEREERASRRESRAVESGTPQAGEADEARLAALNALLQMDAENAIPILRRVLSDRTAGSANVRRKAVFLVSQKNVPEREEILLDAARNDPDAEVREQAVFWLSQVRTDRAVTALDSILQSSTEPGLQEKAIFALAQNRSERAAEILRDYARRADAPRELRAHAIHWLGQGRSGGNVTFLRDLYTQLDDRELKERVIFVLSQTRSDDNAAYLLNIALDQAEDIELRKRALFWIGQTRTGGGELYGLYDRVTSRELKEQLLFVFSQRGRDPAAVDKLIDIVRTEPDLELRKRAIFWLGQTSDPRAAQVLEEIIRQ